jgi:hypothetical protein
MGKRSNYGGGGNAKAKKQKHMNRVLGAKAATRENTAYRRLATQKIRLARALEKVGTGEGEKETSQRLELHLEAVGIYTKSLHDDVENSKHGARFQETEQNCSRVVMYLTHMLYRMAGTGKPSQQFSNICTVLSLTLAGRLAAG